MSDKEDVLAIYKSCGGLEVKDGPAEMRLMASIEAAFQTRRKAVFALACRPRDDNLTLAEHDDQVVAAAYKEIDREFKESIAAAKMAYQFAKGALAV